MSPWPQLLRLSGATSYPEFNQDYALWSRDPCWKSAREDHVISFKRDWLVFKREGEPRNSYIAARLPPRSAFDRASSLAQLHDWEEWDGREMQKSQMDLQPLVGRFDKLCNFRDCSKPEWRDDHGRWPLQTGVREMNYTQHRCPGWSATMAVAELVQNWKDEADAAAERCGATAAGVRISRTREKISGGTATTYHAYCELPVTVLLATLELRQKDGKETMDLNLTNFSDQMQVEMLFDGYSGQDKMLGTRRGKFGDGLQSAICVLSRAHIDVKIYSNGHVWRFGWASNTDLAREKNFRLLQLTTERCPPFVSEGFGIHNCVDDTCVRVVGVQKAAFDESQFLFLCAATPVLSNSFGDILLGDACSYSGSVYVKDMRVLSRTGMNKYGLNLHKFESTARDRMEHMAEGQKLLHTFDVWHEQLTQGDKHAAELLYTALEDINSLETRSFTHPELLKRIDASAPIMLLQVFRSRHPGAFAICETDYKGHKLVMHRIKRKSVNLNLKLFAVLRKNPAFQTPQEYWEQEQKKLAECARRIEGTEKQKLVIEIVRASVCAAMCVRVSYDTDPGQDIMLSLKSANGRRTFVVQSVEADGPASMKHLPVGAELCDFEPNRARMHGSVRLRLLKRSGVPLQDLQPCLMPRVSYPATFTFQAKMDIDSSQFELVSASDLQVAIVAMPRRGLWGQPPRGGPSARSELASARFVVNGCMCHFHKQADPECPTDDGACYCGVHDLYEGLLEELDRKFSIKFSDKNRRWMDQQKQKLLRQHRASFLTTQPSAASAGGVVKSSPKPLPDVASLLKSWVQGRVDQLSAEEQAAVRLAEGMASELDRRRMIKADSSDPQNAWLGDRLNDLLLAISGLRDDLTPHQLDQVRQKVLSAEGLSGGRGRRGRLAEDLEAQVGRAAQLLPDEDLLRAVRNAQVPRHRLAELLDSEVRAYAAREPVRLRPNKARRVSYEEGIQFIPVSDSDVDF